MTNLTHTDSTHDPSLRSWIDSANDPETDFPIQNLPFGVFRVAGTDQRPRIGVAIGECVLDLHRCVTEGLLGSVKPEACCALSATTLNDFLALGRSAWRATRAAVSDLLSATGPRRGDVEALGESVLVNRADAEVLLPARIGDYTDFYASIHHATNVGSMFRPQNPLLPNYKHLPVGYHGRASSIVISGTPVRRPHGQTMAEGQPGPVYGPCRLLDYELEMGFFVGPANPRGRPVGMTEARDHIFGLAIVNDWSARDIQKWEYQPLGPFCAKNFATTISPWVVTLEALEPYRNAGPRRGDDDPPLLEYLQPVQQMGYDITVEASLSSKRMRDQGMQPLRLSRGTLADMYWTIAQMLVHHTSTGCNLAPGDLLATGTVSGAAPTTRGCLLELTWRGEKPLTLPDGTKRSFLADGDEVIMRAWCQREGAARIGFGECRGIVLPAE